ncbi:transmembrane protein 200A [Pseudophryne corroboree]|uniref:transmembrane protein 200A n=1 Tax=Pseudophryne corroboree TaxID=495146 RepID=UPI00308219E1
MIATGGVITGLAALKRQDSARSQHLLSRPTSPPTEKKPVRRRPRADVVIVRGKIRLYSPSGFFLILGVLVSVAGIAMAVLGYWPQKETFLTPDITLEVNKTQILRETGMMVRFFEQHLHSEKMKMLGPFTMGIGIFIFICANAILHENRDKETKVIHMRDIYSTVIDIHSMRIKEQKHLNGTFSGLYGEAEYRHSDNPCASKLAANTIASFPGSYRSSSSIDDEGSSPRVSKGFTNLLPPLLMERSGSVFGLHCHSNRIGDDRSSNSKRCETKSIVSSSINAFTLPVIKLNNCVIDEPDIDNITEDSDISSSRPRNVSMDSLSIPLADDGNRPYKPVSSSLSRSCSIMEPLRSNSSIVSAPNSGTLLSPGAASKQFGSNTSLHILSSHSKSLDLDRGPSTLTVQAEQRKHPSWPRLDRSNSKGYMKLENKEDPMDRLIVPQAPPARKDYTNKEKLLMISRSHNNLSFENDEFLSNNLKRGTSETRF